MAAQPASKVAPHRGPERSGKKGDALLVGTMPHVVADVLHSLNAVEAKRATAPHIVSGDPMRKYVTGTFRVEKKFKLLPGNRLAISPTPYSGRAFTYFFEPNSSTGAYLPECITSSGGNTVDNQDYNTGSVLSQVAGMYTEDFAGTTLRALSQDLQGDDIPPNRCVSQFAGGQLRARVTVPFQGQISTSAVGALELKDLVNTGTLVDVFANPVGPAGADVVKFDPAIMAPSAYGQRRRLEIAQIPLNSKGLYFLQEFTTPMTTAGQAEIYLELPMRRSFPEQWQGTNTPLLYGTNSSVIAGCYPLGNFTDCLRQGQGYMIFDNNGLTNVEVVVTGCARYHISAESTNPIFRSIAESSVKNDDLEYACYIGGHAGMSDQTAQAAHEASFNKQLSYASSTWGSRGGLIKGLAPFVSKATDYPPVTDIHHVDPVHAATSSLREVTGVPEEKGMLSKLIGFVKKLPLAEIASYAADFLPLLF